MYFYPGDLISWSEHFPPHRVRRVRIGLVLEYSTGTFIEEVSCKILLENGRIMNHLPITSTLRKIGGKVL